MSITPQIQRLMHAAAIKSRAGDIRGAVELLRQAAKGRNAPFEAVFELAKQEHALGRVDEASATLRRAARLRPNSFDLQCQIAATARSLGDLNAAHRAADAAERLKPDHSMPRIIRAELQRMDGRFDEAGALIASIIDSGERAPQAVMTFGALAKRLDREDEAIELFQRLIDDARVPPPIRNSGRHRLAKIYDAMGRYDEAFDLLETAHAASKARFHEESWRAGVERMFTLWSSETLSRLPRAEDRWSGLTLVVGMPRSGTSLVEQILTMHPRVHGGGERMELQNASRELYSVPGAYDDAEALINALTPAFAARLARTHIGALHSLDYSATRITDKMPYNFRHLGLASVIAPGAKVIHCRRNPLDTCLSCYMQDFAGVHPFVHRQEHLGLVASSCARLMDHWRDTLDVPILTLDYESLVVNQEAETRRLLEFLDLEWDDACLRFHESRRVAATASNEQVRQKIYTSAVGRAKRYEHRLGPLKEALEAAHA